MKTLIVIGFILIFWAVAFFALAIFDAWLTKYLIKRAEKIMQDFDIHETREGKIILISEMTDEHLKNALAYGQHYQTNPYWDKMVPKFAAEIKRRKL